MKKILLPEISEDCKYYRANIHCHSDWSDGSKSPEQLKEDYKAHGYSILCITDHNIFVNHNDMTDDDFLMLNGYEMEVPSDTEKTCHLCLVALDKDMDTQVCFHRNKYLNGNTRKHLDRIKYDETKPDYDRIYTAEGVNDMIKQGVDNGFFVTYNHPTWSLESYPDYMRYEGMNAMEIVNFGCDICGYDDDNGHCYDDLLRGGKKLYCIATDDNHNRHGDDSPDCDSYGGYIMLAMPALNYEEAAKALKDGMFYSSTGNYKHVGPEIKSLYIEDNKVKIKTSDVRSITYVPDNRGSRIRNAEYGGSVNEAEFDISPKTEWFRIVVSDNNGYKAYTNAYFVKD